ncbi:hypothetical protein D3C74_502250 [compost metagenome]
MAGRGDVELGPGEQDVVERGEFFVGGLERPGERLQRGSPPVAGVGVDVGTALEQAGEQRGLGSEVV